MSKTDSIKAKFESGFNCAQSIFSTYAEEYGLSTELALKIADGFGAGMGYTAKTCGAVTGAVMVLGLIYGRSTDNDKSAMEKKNKLVKEFIHLFEKKYGSINCKEILGYDISIQKELDEVKEKKLFATSCSSFVNSSAEILEILIN